MSVQIVGSIFDQNCFATNFQNKSNIYCVNIFNLKVV